MSLAFTDEQMRETTGQILDEPIKIATIQSAKEKAVKLKQDFKDLDDTNAVYTTHFRKLIEYYHLELKYFTGTAHTDPTTNGIDAGGRLSPGNVYFTDTWANFQPKLANEVIGLPTSVWSDTEPAKHALITKLIALLKTGFTDGVGSVSPTGFTANTATAASNTGFSPGNRFVAYGSTGFAYGTITSITGGGPYTFNLVVEFGSLTTIGAGATLKNADSGFTLTERDTGVSARQKLLDGYKSTLDTKVTEWHDMLDGILDVNPDAGFPDPHPEGDELSYSRRSIQHARNEASFWLASPATGVGVSRYGALIDSSLAAEITTRTADIATRITQIPGWLGSVSQNPDGSYTGTGNYFQFFTSLNLRLNKVGGTLRNFYQQDLMMGSFDQQIAVIQATGARDRQFFEVHEFAGDANGTGSVHVKDISNLGIGQSLYVMSNTQPALFMNITGMHDNTVELSDAVPTSYTVSDRARLVRKLN